MRKRVYKRPFLLYHWSPVERRNSILKKGLRISQKPEASCLEDWCAPYICFSDSPSLAWALSARFLNKASEWDLWMCWSNAGPLGKPIGRRDDLTFPTEYRVFENIPKKKLWLVGTRSHVSRKRLRSESVHGGKIVPKIALR